MRRADIFPPGWLAEELADALRIMRRWRATAARARRPLRAASPKDRPTSPKDRKTR